MKRLLLLIVLLLAIPAALAAPPKLVIPAEVKPAGQYAIVQPDTDAESVLYIGLDGIEPFPAAILADKRVFALDTFGKKAGRYRFVAVGAKGGEQARADFVLVIGDAPKPPDPPKPDPPKPDPPKPPVASRVWIITVSETGARTGAEGRLLRDLDFWQGWDAEMWGWKLGQQPHYGHFDPDEPEVKAKNFNTRATEHGLDPRSPYMLILNEIGTTLRAVKLPATAAEVRALVKEVTGK